MSEVAEATTIIGELETSMGMPVVVFMANWKGEYAVDPGEEGGRRLASTLAQVHRRQGEPEEMALVMLGRGGTGAFCDQVLRCAANLGIRLDVVVPHRIDGAPAMVALGADRITLHPQGGIGAVDAGVLVAGRQRIDASLQQISGVDPLDLVSLSEADKAFISRLAYERQVQGEMRQIAHRWLSGETPWAMQQTLGRAGALGADELREEGVNIRVTPAPLAEQLEELLTWAESFMHLFRMPSERFEVSAEVADEVEFEPATLIPAAVLLEASGGWLFELDTGSPDPFAPRLLGQWSNWEPEAVDGETQGE